MKMVEKLLNIKTEVMVTDPIPVHTKLSGKQKNTLNQDTTG